MFAHCLFFPCNSRRNGQAFEPFFIDVSRSTRPLSVRRYFCWLLLGLSGIVGSMISPSIRGCKMVFLKRVRFVCRAIAISSSISTGDNIALKMTSKISLGTDLGQTYASYPEARSRASNKNA